MTFDYVDVQWNVVCRSSPQEIFETAVAHARDRGWSFEDLEVTDLDGTSLSLGDKWPSETMGSAKYIKKQSEDESFSLFWSTYSNGRLCQVTGGLYIREYTNDSNDFTLACNRALDDLRQLFGGNEVLCIVLALEDDEGINVAPGLIGLYRPSIWCMTSNVHLRGISVETRDEWIAVRPEPCRKTEPNDVLSMQEETTATIKRIQLTLEKGLWGH